ncbi:hypothetical protein [Rhizobium leguminosarum]|uniref:hypothetical protein n=1 Tax=Rhizobium leguminosarum TaxID=384 RepID=UPI001C900B43|nr:hypothetical protein [Rhizobium leguminosarum]MBY2932706.1 hypothetical protein [Rhizobium leguminosarum]
MSKVGGPRPGSGRKPGTLNQRTVELTADILGSGKTPLQYLLEVMVDESADQKRRDWAAEKAAAFIHPRPAPTPRTVQLQLPTIDTAKDMPGAIAGVLKAVTEGEISPSEAQSVVAIIEAQRKAVETTHLLERIEALEGRITR